MKGKSLCKLLSFLLNNQIDGRYPSFKESINEEFKSAKIGGNYNIITS